jgi:hypothetical protein
MVTARFRFPVSEIWLKISLLLRSSRFFFWLRLMRFSLSLEPPHSVAAQPMAPSELLLRGPTPVSEFDLMRWTGFPGHADLQLEGHLLAAAGAFLAHGIHKTPQVLAHSPHSWPAGFISVVEDLGIDDVSDRKLADYVAKKRASLFDAVKSSSFHPSH